jgi:tRNA pseudouridine32 synthase/23S rRNA pseudouridine746 synthase
MFSILYEDRDILAIDKPAGLATIPERRIEQQSLLHELIKLYPFKIYVVHRLDKEVSGVILFTKNSTAHRSLNEQFTRRLVKKTYIALVHGLLTRETGEINMPIRQYGSGRMAVDWQTGKECSTAYQVQGKYKNCTLLYVYPHTGRRHQIRVHLYNLGHPVIGDLRYGDKNIQKEFPRLMLHAHKVEFKTVAGEERIIESPQPDLFMSVLAMCRNRAASEP